MNILGSFLNIIHVLFVLFPILIFLLPKKTKKWFKYSFKYIMLIYLLTPLHWIYFDNNCVLSVITKKYGYNAQQNIVGNNSTFSEIYFKWFYKPPMRLFGWKWPNDINLIINLHWIINFILLWYYAFFINVKLNK